MLRAITVNQHLIDSRIKVYFTNINGSNSPVMKIWKCLTTVADEQSVDATSPLTIEHVEQLVDEVRSGKESELEFSTENQLVDFCEGDNYEAVHKYGT